MNWNRYPHINHSQVEYLFSRFEKLPLEHSHFLLPYGNGRSYSDCCLNEHHLLLSTKKLNHFIAFDTQKGLLTCEAGITLAEILAICVPQNWFLPVLPGTQHVSLGGAIANDIHGKNHFHAGSFGCHIVAFELLRSDGRIYHCTPDNNTHLFNATIGGLGLTGVILSATIKLKAIVNPFLQVTQLFFRSLDDFLKINAEAVNQHEYTVAWVDPYSERGIYSAANHYKDSTLKANESFRPSSINIPLMGHPFIFNSITIGLFNRFYFHRSKQKPKQFLQHYDSFFFPLDKIKHWNQLYGKNGFLQYQCLLPTDPDNEAVKALFTAIKRAKRKSSLVVLKSFGERLSPGALSFPQAGMTIAMDFANPNRELLLLFKKFDKIVMRYHGKVNPAKDARMSSLAFNRFFPNWRDYAKHMDPRFSSSFWRRVTRHL